MAAEAGAVDLDLIGKLHALNLAGQGLADLVRQDEGRLVLAIDVPTELEGGHALDGVHADADGGAEVHEGHLAGGEDGPRRDGELVSAGGALELAAALHVIGAERAAAGADGSAVRLRPAHPAERGIGGVLAGLVDRGQGESAGLSREEEVLGHCPRLRCLYIAYDGTLVS